MSKSVTPKAIKQGDDIRCPHDGLSEHVTRVERRGTGITIRTDRHDHIYRKDSQRQIEVTS